MDAPDLEVIARNFPNILPARQECLSAAPSSAVSFTALVSVKKMEEVIMPMGEGGEATVAQIKKHRSVNASRLQEMIFQRQDADHPMRKLMLPKPLMSRIGTEAAAELILIRAGKFIYHPKLVQIKYSSFAECIKLLVPPFSANVRIHP